MTTSLHQQRLDAVRDAVLASGARTVLDLGCGDGDLLVRLVSEPQIDRIVGVDLSRDRLDRLRARLAALGENSARRVDLVHGSMTEGGAALAGFDCALLVETIEHIEPDRLSVLERSVFGAMRPATVVITTPNADFNPLLGVPTDRFRHPDHRFEWGRAKFRRWADGVAERNRYHVVCSDLAGCHPVHGGATQMAVFRMAPVLRSSCWGTHEKKAEKMRCPSQAQSTSGCSAPSRPATCPASRS
jgi:3' terminal RNA ribose 2'-O-methyltransferase Hen1